MNPWILVLALLIAVTLLAGAHRQLWCRYWSLFRSRRNISRRDCQDRLSQLGFQSMQEYRASDLWRLAKRRYRNSDYPQTCLVCGSGEFDLHHRSYARLGAEELFDLVPLCRRHHDDLHQILDRSPDLCVKDTHDFLALLMEDAQEAYIEDTGAGKRSPGVAAAGEADGNLGVPAANKGPQSRAGSKWSAEEDAALLEGYDQGVQVEQLAESLHRGVRAVEVRVQLHAPVRIVRTRKRYPE